MTYELRKTDENVLIAEGASVTGDVRLAKGVSIWYGAVLRGDMGPITVGEAAPLEPGAKTFRLQLIWSTMNPSKPCALAYS